MAAAIRWLAGLGTSLLLAAAACPLRAAAPGRLHGEDDLLLLEVQLGGVVLANSLPAYQTPEGVLLPLGGLCQELDLAIEVDPAKGVAEGFLIEEKRHFRLDGRTGALALAGAERTLDPALMELHADDLYLDARLMAQCLPLELAVDRRAARITVTPREPLPLQLRWQREGQAGRLAEGAGGRADSFPPLADPYRLLEFPALDATAGLGANAGVGGGRRFNGQGSLLAAGDLLYLSTDVFAGFQDPGGLTDFHMSLGRRDPHGGLLGPLRATEFAVGEVQSSGLNLVAGSWGGTGALVTNQVLQTGDAFDRRSFRGDLPPGWQVELYRNRNLVAFQAARPDGRYELLNIPLFFGPNDFQLVFYGPQGQRRVETVRLEVSETQTPAGVFHYQAVRLQPQGEFLARHLFQASYGLSPQVTALLGAALVSIDQVSHDYAELGLLGYWKLLSTGLTAARDSRGGTVAELALRGRLGQLGLVGKRAELRDGFLSETFKSGLGAIRSRTSLELSGQLPDPDRPWVSLGLSGTRDQLVAGGSSETLDVRLGTSLGGTFFSNILTRTRSRGLDPPAPAVATGSLLASKVFRGFALRGQAGYTLADGRRLDNLSLTGEGFRFDPYLFQAELDYTVASRDTALHLGANRTRGNWTLGADLGYSTVSRWSAAVNLRLGLTREPRGRRFFATAQGATGRGAVSVQSFLDANNNGRRDPGERPLPNVAFNVNGSRHPHLTDSRGVAFLDGLAQGQDSNIAVATGTLEDPLMRPEVAGVRVTPRPGHVVRLDVPIVLFGEINGTAYRLEAGRRTPVAGLRVELRDAAGRVFKSLRTAVDGFYSLDEVPPGSYRLEVPEAAASRLGAHAPAPRAVLLSPEGTVLDGQDLILEVAADAVTPAGEAK